MHITCIVFFYISLKLTNCEYCSKHDPAKWQNFQSLTYCDTAVEHKLCTNQIRTQTGSLPPSLTLNSACLNYWLTNQSKRI